MLVLKIAFALCLVAVLISGYFVLKNFDRWFGMASEVPSENESAVLLSKTQAWAIWIIAIKICVMMLFIL